MKCKNQHCNGTAFIPVFEVDTHRLFGVKCMSCNARYATDDIEIKKSLKRIGWNGVHWQLGYKQ